MSELSKATHELEAAYTRLCELKRWSKVAGAFVIVSVPVISVILIEAVLIEPKLAVATIPFVISLLLGIFLWGYVNFAEVWIRVKRSDTYDGYHTTRMKQARKRHIEAREAFDEAFNKDLNG